MKSDGSFSCMFFFFFLQTVKCIVGGAEKQPSVHFTVLNELTRSSHIICIYLFIANNICKNSVKEQGVEVPLRIKKKIIKLINIMLIYRYMYTVLSPRSMGCHSRVFSLPFHRVNASHANHHVCNFTLKETYHAFFFPFLCFISVREHVKVHGSSSLIQKTLLLMCLKCLVSSSAFVSVTL